MTDPSATVTIERAPTRGHVLRVEQHVPRPRAEVFGFFADAFNLERITPPWLHFRIVTPPPITMAQGTLIDYRLRLRGWPVRWQSEISSWQPGEQFVDEQRRGPYRWWVHEHRFSDDGDGTRVEDEVHYGVPGGQLVHRLLVARELRTIFAYRGDAVRSYFAGTTSAARTE